MPMKVNAFSGGQFCADMMFFKVFKIVSHNVIFQAVVDGHTAVDDELQVAARCHEGIAETESFLVKSGTLATYIYFITLQDEKIDMMLH